MVILLEVINTVLGNGLSKANQWPEGEGARRSLQALGEEPRREGPAGLFSLTVVSR